ncbi:hypothetical protein COCVIDRAFT_19916 [Bipolaris victoriae FI3]|uniref:Uncharacterized protein n=1 Tax=Bipolaris victoriae (strain FI3) TaxID=930091 RepID=W7DW80_BIPV3|nr:hypothetical protein COCVIDRAFT_19916 [Bipolaris victoriae FI3]
MAKRSKRGLEALCGNRAGGSWAAGQPGSHVVMGHGHGPMGGRRAGGGLDGWECGGVSHKLIFSHSPVVAGCLLESLARCSSHAPHRAAQARSFAVGHIDRWRWGQMHGPTRHPLILAMALVGLLSHSGHSVLVDIPERQQSRHVLQPAMDVMHSCVRPRRRWTRESPDRLHRGRRWAKCKCKGGMGWHASTTAC